MKVRIKISTAMFAAIREDLCRPHPVAHERVGFITAGVAASSEGLLVIARMYRPVDDEDYEPDPTVGVKIGPEAIRKALQAGYRPPGAVLHVHTHGGRGRPEFSGVDRHSAREFVPSFFNPIPRMPHGIVVLSNDSARGLIWLGPHQTEIYAAEFISIGAPLIKLGGQDGVA